MITTCCAPPVRKRKKPELKPCPFCGGPASLFCVEQPSGELTYEVDCENDGCEVSACTMLYPTREEAAAVWNRRPSDD